MRPPTEGTIGDALHDVTRADDLAGGSVRDPQNHVVCA